MNSVININHFTSKAVFDAVCHDSLLRKLYHMGVEGAPWLLIRSLDHYMRVAQWLSNGKDQTRWGFEYRSLQVVQ